MSIYEYKLTKADGQEVSLEAYRGKVMLIVNTATGCGFTPQYDDLEKLYEKYHDMGLEIIDIPCNQFAGQTPGTDKDIAEFCRLRFGAKYMKMKKAEVNGPNALPLYSYLKEQQNFHGFGRGLKAFAMHMMLRKIDKDYKHNSDIKWNFTKFIVDREGEVVKRFEPNESMREVKKFIKHLVEVHEGEHAFLQEITD